MDELLWVRMIDYSGNTLQVTLEMVKWWNITIIDDWLFQSYMWKYMIEH